MLRAQYLLQNIGLICVDSIAVIYDVMAKYNKHEYDSRAHRNQLSTGSFFDDFIP